VLQEMGLQAGLYTTTYCRTADDVRRLLTADGLRDVDAVFFANTTGDLGIPDMAAFLGWIQAGHAFLGAHSASDTYHEDRRYIDMLGGEFQTHGDQTSVDLNVEAPTHPAVSHMAPRFRVFDEIYEFVVNNRSSVDVLLSLDRHPNDGHPGAGQPGDFLLAWTKSFGTGRVFYTALGHREDVWESAAFRQHIRGAMQWALAR
jgi:type 1 glutamine amidotransferase